jgi:hypothetical protein
VTPDRFVQLHVSEAYSIGRWIAEYNPPDRDRRVRIKQLFDRRIEYGDCVESNGEAVEYTCSGSVVRGLSTAFLADGLAVSLLSDDRWDVARVRVEKSWIDGEKIEVRQLDVIHAGRLAHVETHAEWLRRIQTPPPTSGLDLWNQRESLFSRLDFCESAVDQIKNLGGDGPTFRAVVRGLQDLQNYCETWSSGGFDIHAFNNASGESRPTMQTYRDERIFRCPDGQHRVFEWHLKRGNTRIYFIEFPTNRRLLVGYVGGHLRTVSS